MKGQRRPGEVLAKQDRIVLDGGPYHGQGWPVPIGTGVLKLPAGRAGVETVAAAKYVDTGRRDGLKRRVFGFDKG